jgi:pyruvate,water dikinase
MEIGHKAANLVKLLQNGIKVPSGFCINGKAFDYFLSSGSLGLRLKELFQGQNLSETAVTRGLSKTAYEFIRNQNMSDELIEGITGAYLRLAEATGVQSVAVRSSASFEDSAKLSGAGMLDSFLGVSGNTKLLMRVKDCWASQFTERGIFYRQHKGLDIVQQVAVIVQEMLSPNKSGILFTADPVTGDLDYMMIESNWGLGTTIVGGTVSPDRYIINRLDGTVESTVGSKRLMALVKDGELIEQETTTEQQRISSLTTSEIDGLRDIALRVENLMGAPQDIEWGIVGTEIHVLQTRPLTTLNL